jgi:hypothetical protein
MPPAGDEGNVVPRLRQARAEVSAYTSGTHDCDAQVNLLHFRLR